VSGARVIEVSGSAHAALARVTELRTQGWKVSVRGSRLTSGGDVVWSLSVIR